MDRFTIMIVIATLCMAWLLRYYYRKGFSTFARIPAKSASQVIDGEVIRVKGTVTLPGKTLVAPLSNRVCAFYNVIVTQYWESPHTNRKGYQVTETRAGDLVMRCEDDTWVVIGAQDADSDIGNEYNETYNFWSLDRDTLNTFLHKHGKKYDPVVALGERITTAEQVIIAGDVLWVAGKARWRSTSELDFSLPVRNYLHITAPQGERVRVRNFGLYG